ncbi:MAG: CapA family protein [Anaerolineales bacterium]
MKRRRCDILIVILIATLFIGCKVDEKAVEEVPAASVSTEVPVTDTPAPATDTPIAPTETPLPPTEPIPPTETPEPSPTFTPPAGPPTPRTDGDMDGGEHTTILLTGDSMLGRSVNFRARSEGDLYPFSKVREEISGADIAVTNLESPLIKDCPPTNEGMVFCGDCALADNLKAAGFDVAMISNNHIRDWGEKGYAETVDCLRERNINAVGIDHTLVKSVEGVEHGFLGYDAVWRDIPEEVLQQDIGEIKREVDNVLVYFHWGEEYTHEPTEHQVNLAHRAIDHGADIVFGSHPHWIQPITFYEDKPIIYSLGNFVFDQGWSEETMRGLAVKLFYDGETLVDIQLLPVKINEDWSASWMEGTEKEAFWDDFEMPDLLPDTESNRAEKNTR